jgi:hypothetical protein
MIVYDEENFISFVVFDKRHREVEPFSGLDDGLGSSSCIHEGRIYIRIDQPLDLDILHQHVFRQKREFMKGIG